MIRWAIAGALFAGAVALTAFSPDRALGDEPAPFEYWYKAVISAVYDGDTVTADIDLGFNIILKNQKLRLYGIDAPEIRGDEREEGLKARDWLREEVLGKEIVVQTYKDRTGKYGRWLVTLYIPSGGYDVMMEVNGTMIERGMAEPYLP